MDTKAFISGYFEDYKNVVFEKDSVSCIENMKEMLINVKEAGKKVIFAGNGASAAIAGHAALDFTKQAKVRAVCFNESALITAFSNDYGYENWIEKAVGFYADKGDVIVLISSSGSSLNILNAVKAARSMDLEIVTFSGFKEDNSLRALGDVNFWANSNSYNIVESAHMFWLMTVCDLIIGNSEYSVY